MIPSDIFGSGNTELDNLILTFTAFLFRKLTDAAKCLSHRLQCNTVDHDPHLRILLYQKLNDLFHIS